MSRVRALPILLLLSFVAASAFAADPPATPGGTRMTGAAVAPRSFEFGQLPQRQPGVIPVITKGKPEGINPEAERVLEEQKRNPKGPTPEQLGQFTFDQAPTPFELSLRTGAGPLAPVTGNGFDGISQGGYIPSEPTVAGGPLNIFSAGNVSVTVTNKDGSNRVETSGATFFGVPASEGAISDAQCYYDALRGRFVALCFTQGTSPNFSHFYLAISKTSDARGAWWLYVFDMSMDGTTSTSNWSDYQALGVSDDKIAMTAQQFSFGGNQYKYPKVRVLDRAAAYAGQTLSYVDFVNFAAPPGGNSNDVFVTKAARNLSPDNTIHLFNVRTGGGTNVTYRTITGTPSSPALSAGTRITVGSYAAPPDAAQLGSATLVATNDCRPTDFYWRNGVLTVAWHTAATIGGGAVSAIRLFRLRTSDLAVLTDETYGAANTFYYYPAVTVDSLGTIFLGFDRSSSTEYPSAYATGKRRGDATLQSSALLKAGVSATAQSRWGDYTGIDNDATASGPGGSVAWYAGQYTKGTNTFGTWINKLSFTYGQFAGTVLEDVDGSAATTGDRSAIAGVTLTLKQGATTLATTTSSATGAWNFGYLESGTYDVVVTPPASGSAVDAIAGTGATTQVRVSATDLQAALTNAQTSAGNTFVVATSHPLPATTSITPAAKSLNDPGFTMTVNGSGFAAYSVVRFDGNDRTTTYVSPGQLTAQIPASDNAVPGPHAITVFNPSPGGGTSNAQTFTVSGSADTQAPVVSVTSPAGGESWGVGSAHNITWTATDDGIIESVDLAWSSDGGATFPNAIATGLPNSGSYAWTVPMVLTSAARVRVVAHDGGGHVGSDSSHTNVAFTGWTVTASAGAHGSISPSGAIVVADGATPAFTIAPATNYHVADVLVNNISVGPVTNYAFAPVHANQTIAASFAIDTYTLTVTTSGIGTVTIDPDQGGVYAVGQLVTLTAVPDAAWSFINWTGDATGSDNPLAILMTGNKTIQAVFGQHTYTWNATGSAAFGTATNWTPNRTSPAADDKLVFSSGNTVTATGVTTQTIGQLLVSNNTNVSLTASASATLTIAGLDGTDLDVPAGSTLQLTGASALTIALASGANGSVFGTAVAAGGGHRLTALGTNALVFGAGSQMTLGTGFTGSIFGAGTGTSALNSVVFQNGSLLAQAAGANPFGATAPSSVLMFQAGSRFRLDGAVTPSFSARTYADFEDNYSGTTNVTGGTAFSVDSVIVTQGTFGLNVTGGGTIHGNLSVRPGATLNFTPSSGTPTYLLAGGATQYVNIGGTFSQGVNLTVGVNNPSGVQLLSDWTLSGPLAFSGGIVTTGANTLGIGAAGSVTGASQGTGWVAGNLRRNFAAGSSSRTFDVGGAATYAPAAVSMNGAVAAFDVTGSTSTPDHPNLGTSDLDAAKTVNRWWRLTPSGSPSFTSYDAVFNFSPADVDAGANTAALGVRRYASGAWSAPATGTRTATSTQATGLAAFGDFALGETVSFTIAASAGTGGVISPSGPVSVAYGGGQAFTITANSGWSIADVLVDGGSVGAVGNYAFSNVTANHTIAASFADLVPPVVAVTAPNGGESFAIAATAPITWTATDLAGVTGVDLLLSRTGAGGPYDTLAVAQPNGGSYDWVVTGPATGNAFVKVIAHDAGGNTAADASDAAFTIGSTTGVDDGVVTAFALSAVRPNPMRSNGVFGFALPRAAQVRLSVMDVQGREVMVLADGEYAAGRHTISWANGQRGRLGSGLYFVRMRADGRTFTTRFVIAQ